MRALIIMTALVVGGCGGGSGRPTGLPIPVPDTIRTIIGQLGYFTTGPQPVLDATGRVLQVAGFVDSTLPAPAPRFPVQILRPDGSLLAEGFSGADGRFSIDVDFGQNPATQVIVRTEARIHLPFGTSARVLPNAAATEPYSHQTAPSGDPDDRTMEIDLSVTLTEGAAAYRILDILYEAFIAARSGILATMPDLDLYWEPGNGDTSTFAGGPLLGKLTIAGGITGNPASNRDAWDASQVARLLGEYLLFYFFNDVAPAGTPNDALMVPSAAWREGFLDFWACISIGSRQFLDTEGMGAQGRIVRFFDIESFFDPALPSLGPNDPNVYQDPSAIGIGSRFSVAEILWDIHDAENEDGTEPTAFPLFLTLRFLAEARAGASYPYLFTLFDRYGADGSLDPVTLDILTRFPEDQGDGYLGAEPWPPPITDGTQPPLPVVPPFGKTVSDTVDTLNPDPPNLEIGLHSQRYFQINLGAAARLTATLATTGALVIDFLDRTNRVLATGASPLVHTLDSAEVVIIRIRSATDPQLAPFDLTVDVDSP